MNMGACLQLRRIPTRDTESRPLKAILMIGIFVGLSCARAADVPSPTGQMVDIGGRKLHIHCTGKGAPTVIVENGGAAFSFDWELVQPEVERFTRICTYDRAGYAWSDAGPEFDTFDQSVHDLHLLLRNAGIAGPYVLVGHSFGGLLVRFYQATYPGNVVGMVLVDSSHEESIQQVGPRAVRIPELTADQYRALIEGQSSQQPGARPRPGDDLSTLRQAPRTASDPPLVGAEKSAPTRQDMGAHPPIRSQPPAESPHRQPTSIGENAIGGIDRVRFSMWLKRPA